MNLPIKSKEALDYIREHGNRVSTTELAEGLGVVTSSVTGRINKLVNEKLAFRDKVAVEGADKPVIFVQLTDAGIAYTPEETTED